MANSIDVNDYEFVVSFDSPHVCSVYRQFHGKIIIGRIFLKPNGDPHSIPSLPRELEDAALESIQKTQKYLENNNG